MASVEQVGHFCDGIVWFLVVLVVGGFIEVLFVLGVVCVAYSIFYNNGHRVLLFLSLSLSLSLVKVIMASGIVGMNRGHGSLVRCV